ncbi:MAG: hypothetical protein KatS3mg044_1397 [Rhodothermaceae bacterium]|nr:MAG: hypothetical protein KatS3mg043_1531 [Rhodothermaceae bacterium]GIV62531.1 MAG: hypothetical protein KatS3mg044_1397 [Rhodothermaceae bacterium]
MNTNRLLFALLPLALLLFTGCDGTSNVEETPPLEATVVADLPADPATRIDPQTGRPTGTGRYTLFSLRENRIVLGSDEENRADSASTAWDIGFQSTNLIFNGGTSGPGEGAAVLIEDIFENVRTAPENAAFRVDGSAECPSVFGQPGPKMAICPGSGNGWYNYDSQTNVVTPIPGRTIVVRTADGRYAKLRILSYYKGNPDPGAIDPAANPSRYYTFEYVFQPDGSRDLSTN